eukprot:2215529-Ditylum_brightwellii.AAC.1
MNKEEAKIFDGIESEVLAESVVIFRKNSAPVSTTIVSGAGSVNQKTIAKLESSVYRKGNKLEGNQLVLVGWWYIWLCRLHLGKTKIL